MNSSALTAVPLISHFLLGTPAVRPPTPRPARKAPTYGSALECLGVEVAELHVGQSAGAGAGPGPHAGVHGGHPLQQPEDTAVTLELVPAEVPGARGRGGAATWLPPLGGQTPHPLLGKGSGWGPIGSVKNM